MAKSILIVDDSPAIRKATRNYFEAQSEFEVCGEAVDGVDALEKARQLHPDLIILDLQMPRMNGLQAARELKSILPVPIILFTMYADLVDHATASSAGISAVVSKLDDLSVLAQRAESLLVAQ